MALCVCVCVCVCVFVYMCDEVGEVGMKEGRKKGRSQCLCMYIVCVPVCVCVCVCVSYLVLTRALFVKSAWQTLVEFPATARTRTTYLCAFFLVHFCFAKAVYIYVCVCGHDGG